MTQVDDELGALRKRAYGRHADIHLDPESLQRLRELEESALERSAREVEPIEVDGPAPIAMDPIEPVASVEPRLVRPTPEWLLRLLRVRRSTVVILLGFAVGFAAIGATLVLVQRVQPDPLQVGAVQVDRLSVDSGYRIPDFFGGPAQSGDSQAYEAFHGLRAVINAAGFVYGSNGGVCLSVYPEANVTDPTSDSFSGQLYYGCAAGDFPAIVQFDAGSDGLPPEFLSAFSDSTALQFVYDEDHNEVVVFADH